jgi:chemotaxis signal transduction protein
LVDSVTRVVRLPHNAIQTADDILDEDNARSVDGFAKHEGTILIVLDASRVIARC